MNFIKEIMRYSSAVFVAEELYIFGGFLVVATVVAIAVYVKAKRKPNSKTTAGVVATQDTLVAPESPRKDDSAQEQRGVGRERGRIAERQTARETRSMLGPFDHRGLQQTLAQLQDRSSAEATPAFDTTRLKSEVLRPLFKYILDLERSLASTNIGFRWHFHTAGRTRSGDEWRGWNTTDVMRDMPDRMLSFEVDVDVYFDIAKLGKKDSDKVSVKGWFAAGGDGRWTVGKGVLEEGKRESPMYDWYGLKQHINGHVNDVLLKLST